MKLRPIAVMTLSAILFAGGGVEAGPAPRRETQPYNYIGAGPWGTHARFGSAVFETRPSERFISIEVDDVISDNVFFRVHQNLDDDPWWEAEREFCGTRADKIPIEGGYYVYVHFVQSLPPVCDERPHFETTGTVTAIFSR